MYMYGRLLRFVKLLVHLNKLKKKTLLEKNLITFPDDYKNQKQKYLMAIKNNNSYWMEPIVLIFYNRF